jgi:predicted enzyme related to lactoylglutathione lyase
MQIDKLTIATTYTEKMVAFYNTVFNTNLNAVAQSPLYAGHIGNLELVFCPNTIVNIKAEKNRIQFRLIVDDIAFTVRQAEAHGGGAYGERTETDTQINWGISDPDGNSIELVQLL